jgi:uncharacterized protein (DUF302 family)
MNRNFVFRLLTYSLLMLLVGALALPASAQNARVSVPSLKSFEQTIDQLKSVVSQGGMMVMATVDQGNMLAMTGLKMKGTLFLVGNPTVGKQVFEQDHAAGLYLPLRVYVYEAKDGKTYLSYDKPSALLGQLAQRELQSRVQPWSKAAAPERSGCMRRARTQFSFGNCVDDHTTNQLLELRSLCAETLKVGSTREAAQRKQQGLPRLNRA